MSPHITYPHINNRLATDREQVGSNGELGYVRHVYGVEDVQQSNSDDDEEDIPYDY